MSEVVVHAQDEKVLSKIDEENVQAPVEEEPVKSKVEDTAEENDEKKDEAEKLHPEHQEHRSYFGGFMKVSPQVNVLNLVMLVVITFMSAFFYEFLFDFQTQFLTFFQTNDPENFNKKVEKTDSTLQVITLIFFYFAGSFGDRNGRRLMVSVGFLLQSLAFFVIPATDNIYIQYSAAYIIFNIGSLLVFAMTVTSIGDYFHPSCVGKVIGFLSFFGILGAYLGGEVYRKDGVEDLCIAKSYHLQGGLALIMAVAAFLGLQSDAKRKAFQIVPDEKLSVRKASGASYSLLKSDRVFRLACVAAAFGLGASMVTRFFIVGYLHRDWNDRGICNHASMASCFSPRPIPGLPCLVDIRSSECGEQLSDTNSFGCPAGFLVLDELDEEVYPMYAVVATLFMIFADFVPPLAAVLFSSFFGMIAFGYTFKLENMSDDDFYSAYRLWAFSGLLSVLVGVNLLLRSLPAHNKAAAVGFSVGFSAIGAMITHGLGGYLFGTQGLNAPWYVVFVFSVVVFIWTAHVMVKEYRAQKQQPQPQRPDEEGAVVQHTL